MEKLKIRYIRVANYTKDLSLQNYMLMKKSIRKQETVQNLIRKKKKSYFEEKLKENTKNPEKLWKTLKQLGLPDKRSIFTNICIETKNGLTFDLFTIFEVFKKFFFNLVNDLFKKLLAAAEKFSEKSVEDYYNNMFNLNPKRLTFHTIQTKYVSDLLKQLKQSCRN